MTAPFCNNQVCCADCGYFNPYEAFDGIMDQSSGECWRFPHREFIDRPHAHSCGEGVKQYV